MAARRIMKEMDSFQKDPPLDCIAVRQKDPESLYEWEIDIQGPQGSPYEGIVFTVEILFPARYPFHAMTFKFKTPILHCNVAKDGTVCLEELMDSWSPSFTLNKIITQVLNLMSEPFTDYCRYDGWNEELINLYKQDRSAYEAKIREAHPQSSAEKKD